MAKAFRDGIVWTPALRAEYRKMEMAWKKSKELKQVEAKYQELWDKAFNKFRDNWKGGTK